ncbi:type II toxin-antitoxin system HicA family toxin [Thermus altitudinis]|uniref:type II toxin-antitoxin system HicA family toxin n=1 Tax=Thermus altitudinis TaxID=2908145 RepID=UPI001FAAAD5C|nr:toxin HicA [Thermus altitudinis]
MPPKPQGVLRRLQGLDWEKVSGEGSQRVAIHSQGRCPVVPFHRQDKGTFLAFLEDQGPTKEEFRKL